MKNRNFSPRFKFAEFVRVEKKQNKKKIQQTAGRTRAAAIFIFLRFTMFKMPFKILFISILRLFYVFYSAVGALSNWSSLKRIISNFSY